MEIKYSSLTLQQIWIFLTAAKYGNFTRAAEELHMSQSSVSRNILLMEEPLGIILFIRVKKRVRLTSAGEYLSKALLKPYGQLESVINQALDLQANEYRSLKVCDVDTTIPEYYLFPVTELFEKENPEVELSIARKGPVDVIDDLAAGKYDMAFLPSVYSDALTQAGLSFQKFIDLKPCFIISKRHALYGKEDLSYKDLLDNPVVAVSGGKYSAYNEYMRRVMKLTGMKDNPIKIVDNPLSVSTELARGNYVAILDHFYNPAGRDAVRYIEIENIPALFGFVISYSPDSKNPYISRFIKCCRQIGFQG